MCIILSIAITRQGLNTHIIKVLLFPIHIPVVVLAFYSVPSPIEPLLSGQVVSLSNYGSKFEFEFRSN